MKFVFLTNQASYHQMHFARAMVAELGKANFRIVFEKSTSAARAEMGWVDDYTEPYIIRFSESDKARAECVDWINSADVVIQGRFPIKYVKSRIKRGSLTFAAQERFWKKPASWKRKISRFAHLYKNYYSVNKSNYHFLAIGAFAAQDLNELGMFKNRSWRYGYFIDCPKSISVEKTGQLKLLWCARFSEVKQPHKALEILQGLKKGGMPVSLTMIGDGDLRSKIEARVTQMGLQNDVTFTGWQTQDEVFEHMAQTDLFLMTSHYGEGWGLVVNEALSHGCGVMANELLGSARSLVKHGESGVLYHDEDLSDALALLLNVGVTGIRQWGANGHRNMNKHWSAAEAAKRTIGLSQALLSHNAEAKSLYQDGVCSLIETP